MKRTKRKILLLSKGQKSGKKSPYMKKGYKNVLVPIFVNEHEEKLFESAYLQSMEQEKPLLRNLN